MFTIHIFKSTTREYTLDLFEDDGTTESILQAEDEVRVKIGRGGDTPDLDLSSFEELAGGSTIAFTAGSNDAIIKLRQADVRSIEPGAYDCQILVVDNSQHVGTPQEDVVKHAEQGVCFVHPSAGGEYGDEESSSSSSSSSSSG